MLAGLAILGASEDAISGLYVTGTAHAIHGLIVTIGLVIGASVVVAGASWLGIPVWINAQFSIDGLLGPVSVFWSGIVAAAWAFCTRASRRAIVSAGLIGAASWWFFLWLLAQRWPVVAATGAAALLKGVNDEDEEDRGRGFGCDGRGRRSGGIRVRGVRSAAEAPAAPAGRVVDHRLPAGLPVG